MAITIKETQLRNKVRRMIKEAIEEYGYEKLGAAAIKADARSRDEDYEPEERDRYKAMADRFNAAACQRYHKDHPSEWVGFDKDSSEEPLGQHPLIGVRYKQGPDGTGNGEYHQIQHGYHTYHGSGYRMDSQEYEKKMTPKEFDDNKEFSGRVRDLSKKAKQYSDMVNPSLNESFSKEAPRFTAFVNKHGGINGERTSHSALEYIQGLSDSDIVRLQKDARDSLYNYDIVLNDGTIMVISGDDMTLDQRYHSKHDSRALRSLDKYDDPMVRRDTARKVYPSDNAYRKFTKRDMGTHPFYGRKTPFNDGQLKEGQFETGASSAWANTIVLDLINNFPEQRRAIDGFLRKRVQKGEPLSTEKLANARIVKDMISAAIKNEIAMGGIENYGGQPTPQDRKEAAVVFAAAMIDEMGE